MTLAIEERAARERTSEEREAIWRAVQCYMRLDHLARNLSVAGALCRAFRLGSEDGWDEAIHTEDPVNEPRRDVARHPYLWWPGCGRSAP